MLNNIFDSPKTTTAGIIGVLGGVAKFIAAFHFFSVDVITNLNELGNLFITIGLGGIGIFSRDNNVTSKDLGLDNKSS